jgi:hypothetical protein
MPPKGGAYIRVMISQVDKKITLASHCPHLGLYIGCYACVQCCTAGHELLQTRYSCKGWGSVYTQATA